MPKRMKQEWSIPNFLLCGGYIEHLSFVNMWLVILSSYTDCYFNIKMLFQMRKSIVYNYCI